MRIFASILIAGGLFLLAFGGYQLFNTNQAQKKSLAEAEEKIQQARELREQIDPIKEATKFKAEHGEEVGILQIPRSEEHTSELQSRGHLVCRLLLEKKKE